MYKNAKGVYRNDYLKKIYNLVNIELDQLIEVFKNDDEQIWELNYIKEETKKIRKEINNKFLNKLICSKYIDCKYAKLYIKIQNNIKIINDKDVNIRNQIMFDFLSEVFPNIYDYTKNIIMKGYEEIE